MSTSIYYTYKIIFETGHYYIGRRKCPENLNPESDPYMGSPITNKSYWNSVKYQKEIIETYDNATDHELGELYHLNDLWKSDPLCLNASPANNKSNCNMIWCNNGSDSGMFLECPNGWSLGRLGTSAKGKKYYNNGLESKMFFEGEEPHGWLKGNLSSKGDKNPSAKYGAPNKNKIAYNNGTNIIYLNEHEDVPEGYTIGSTESFRKKRRECTIGKNNPRYGSRGEKWYNNGVINKLYVPGNEPKGFTKGMVKKNVKPK